MAAAAELLERDGRDAVSTRAVNTAAGVQAPTPYRLPGDEGGLLRAVAADGSARRVAGEADRDPTAMRSSPRY